MNRITIFLAMLLIFGVLYQSIIATPPTLPCDEEIEDKEVYENIILANEVVIQINDELELYNLEVADCINNERVEIVLYYYFPENYSSYDIIYSDDLALSYVTDGSIELGIYGEGDALNYDDVINAFKDKVVEIENNSRIQEFITKLHPNSCSLIDVNARMTSSDGDWIEYHQTGYVRQYLLPNSIDWEQFPEIKQAHEIIEQNLLVDELSDCSIGTGAMHSYTTASNYEGIGPWYITVALICGDEWKDACLQLNQDGSYERLSIEGSYDVEYHGGISNDLLFMIIILIICIIVATFFIFSWKRKKI